ncbi:MAG: beta-eliminating lyase-related protein, partial [Pseudomonadota bacterium]
MYFASDNSGPVPQQVLDALAEANTGYAMGYGADALTRQVQDQIRDAFEAPDAAVHLVATGTAANVLALSAYTAPWQTVFCTPLSHISCDECNAPEFFSGAKLSLVGSGAHMSADELRTAIEEQGVRGVHGAQRGPVSISQVSEAGVIYSLDEVQALANVAKDYGLPVHMDGARFANAL